MAVPELETHEEAFITGFLAIDHLTAQGRFSPDGSNLCLFAKLPRSSRVYARSVRTEVVGISSFISLDTRTGYRREFHLHHDGESSFFSAFQAAIPNHMLWPLLEKLKCWGALWQESLNCTYDWGANVDCCLWFGLVSFPPSESLTKP